MWFETNYKIYIHIYVSEQQKSQEAPSATSCSRASDSSGDSRHSPPSIPEDGTQTPSIKPGWTEGSQGASSNYQVNASVFRFERQNKTVFFWDQRTRITPLNSLSIFFMYRCRHTCILVGLTGVCSPKVLFHRFNGNMINNWPRHYLKGRGPTYHTGLWKCWCAYVCVLSV